MASEHSRTGKGGARRSAECGGRVSGVHVSRVTCQVEEGADRIAECGVEIENLKFEIIEGETE